MRFTAVLPVKRLGAAKQRLGAGVETERRGPLVVAMLADSLEAAGGARTLERVLVVSGDPEIGRIASAAGAEVLEDPSDSGHSEAAMLGIAAAAGAEAVVLLPGDCPLLDPRELDSLLTGIPGRFVAVVPDRHGTGTNALVLSPPDAISPAFGPGSRERHVTAARAAGIPHAVEELPSLGLDIDTPADIVALARELEARPGRARHTAEVLGI
ncbi:MAG: 2-phospho-L-lactate guanylyltransferase [Solirubrobacterales bacterium]